MANNGQDTQWLATRPPLPEPGIAGTERHSLEEFLDYYRAVLIDRAWGLPHPQLQVELPPSDLTLAKLIAHMALVERIWFQVRFDGEEMPEPWSAMDWDADPDAEMTAASAMTITDLVSHFEESVTDSRQRLSAVQTLDQLSARQNQDGQSWTMRWILIHMIEEYARHCGHADLIRQSIDGATAP